MVLFYFNFTEAPPGFLLTPLFNAAFVHSWGGRLAGWAAFIGISIAAAMLYAALFAKAEGPWSGLLYGLLWGGLLFAAAGRDAGALKPLSQWNGSSFCSEAGVFALWGIFIGYSISYERHLNAGKR